MIEPCRVFKCQKCKKQFKNRFPDGKSVCVPLGDFLNKQFESLQLNFTHRTAHGGDGDKSAEHGSL